MKACFLFFQQQLHNVIHFQLLHKRRRPDHEQNATKFLIFPELLNSLTFQITGNPDLWLDCSSLTLPYL